MKWTTDYLEEDGIVSIKTSGPITWDEHKKMCEEALSFGRVHKSHKFFADHRNLESRLSVLQIDDLPQMFREIGVKNEDKVAVLYDPSNYGEDFKFFQSVSNIALLNFRIFTEENKAMDWLKSGR